MFCENCGMKLEPGAKSCPFCGASISSGHARGVECPGDHEPPNQPLPVRETAPAWESAAPAYQGGLEPPPKSRRGLIIGIAAGAAILLCAVLIFSLRPSDPKDILGRAITKSAAAYAEAIEANPLLISQKNLEDYERRETLSMEITQVSDMLDTAYLDMDFLQGMGLRFTSDLSRSSRSLFTSASLFCPEGDLLSFQLGIENQTGEIYSPELMAGQSLVFDTVTLGSDLARMGVGGFEDLSFDLFTFLDEAQAAGKDADTAAVDALIDAIEVSKGQKTKCTVNGGTLSCDRYSVRIPRGAAEDFFRTMADTAAASQTVAFENFTLEEDVNLSVFLSDGYVVSVEWIGEADGDTVTVRLYFGGGDRYADDLSMEIRYGDAAVLLSSTGNHTWKDGAFTDSTSLRLQNSGLTVIKVSSDFSYDAQGSGGNLYWTLSANNFALEASGRAETGADSLEIHMDDVIFSAYGGMELVTMKADFSAGPCTGEQIDSDHELILSQMTWEDLDRFAAQIERNGRLWFQNLGSKIPALAMLSYF